MKNNADISTASPAHADPESNEPEFVPRRARRAAAPVTSNIAAEALADKSDIETILPRRRTRNSPNGNAVGIPGSRNASSNAVNPAKSSATSAAAVRPARTPSLTVNANTPNPKELKPWYAVYSQPESIKPPQREPHIEPRAPAEISTPLAGDSHSQHTWRTQVVSVPNIPGGDNLDTARINAVTPRESAHKQREFEKEYARRGNHRPRVRHAAHVALSWARMLVIVIAIGFALRLFVFELVYVEGESMQPTFSQHELVFVSKLDYLFSAPQRGDIVICHFPNRDGNFVKRIIGLPDEIVQIIDGTVYIDGVELSESYKAYGIPADYGPVKVGVDQYIVMGDSRSISHDSRSDDVGTLSIDKFVGRVHMVLYPFNQMRIVDNSAPELLGEPMSTEEPTAVLAIAAVPGIGRECL